MKRTLTAREKRVRARVAREAARLISIPCPVCPAKVGELCGVIDGPVHGERRAAVRTLMEARSHG